MTGEGAPVPVVVVGIHGHGATHLATARELEREGTARLMATVDPRPPSGSAVSPVPHYAALEEALGETPPGVVVLSTPLHTHASLATVALEAGCDVLLEKPAVTSISEFDALRATAQRTGRLIQVGFQSMGSAGIDAVAELVAAGAIGDVIRYSATGSWARPLSYWTRNEWAGRRSLSGVPVVDGVLTNPLAHAVQTALRLSGAGREGVSAIDLDQFAGNRIEADDTSVAHITTRDGVPVVCALTLCAAERSEPYVTVAGASGRIRFYYTLDVVQVQPCGRAEPTTTRHGRTDLLRNLLAARIDPGVPLMCPLEDVRAFTQVVDAVRAAPAPGRIPEDRLRELGEGESRRVVVAGVEEWVARAAAEGRTFTELGAPWVA